MGNHAVFGQKLLNSQLSKSPNHHEMCECVEKVFKKKFTEAEGMTAAGTLI